MCVSHFTVFAFRFRVTPARRVTPRYKFQHRLAFACDRNLLNNGIDCPSDANFLDSVIFPDRSVYKLCPVASLQINFHSSAQLLIIPTIINRDASGNPICNGFIAFLADLKCP
uniref:Protein kinase domain-containing protein n=1 Tax=Parascaris univalens TaxID=6257 RepID=A0A915A1F4_PARUN